LALSGELAVMQNQALECSLRDVPASFDADKLLKELEGKEVLIYVEEVDNSRFVNFTLQLQIYKQINKYT